MASSDADRLAAARAGEDWAIEELLRRWTGPVTGYARARGLSDAGEVVNDVLTAIAKGIGRFSGDEGDLRAWIFQIARNKIADHFRRAGRRVPLADGGLDGVRAIGGDVEVDAAARLDRAWLDQVLAALTDDQRDVLLLRVVADLTVDQVADVTGRSRGAVKQLQRRALRRLEAVLAGRPDLHPYPSEPS